MPKNRFAAAPNPTAPPNPIAFCNSAERPFTITGKIFQYQRSAAKADMTMTKGKA